MNSESLVRRVWQQRSFGTYLVRASLVPAALLYRAAAAMRNIGYRSKVLPTCSVPLPVLSVGNLTVGGTGKTPFAAHIVAALRSRGANPAIVMRGYGHDEVLVHGVLNPQVTIYADKDRCRAARTACANKSVDMLILDDGFQHRRLMRDLDVVLVSADRVEDSRWCLPAGPFREPYSALRRADLVVVIRKSVGEAQVSRTVEMVMRHTNGRPHAVATIRPSRLESLSGASRPLTDLRGSKVLAISAIGDPASFEAQLRFEGASLLSATFPDHHEFGEGDASALASAAASAQMAVCTLKDYVKLKEIWPRDAVPLWYVSTAVEIEHGAETLDLMLHSLLKLRPE